MYIIRIVIVWILIILLIFLNPYNHGFLANSRVFILWGCLVFIIILICTSPSISNMYKLIICTVIVLLYGKTIMMFLDVSYMIFNLRYINPIKNMKDNRVIRNMVTNHFNKFFDLKITGSFPSFPTLIIANYVYDRYENFLCITLPVEMSILMRDRCGFLGNMVKHVIYTQEKNNFEYAKREIYETISNGMSVFVYVTTPSSATKGKILRMRSGMFKIAKELNIPITPVYFDYFNLDTIGRITNRTISIRIGDTSYVNDVKTSMSDTLSFFERYIHIHVHK